MKERAPKYAITGHSGDRSMGYDLMYNRQEMLAQVRQWKEDGATEIYVFPTRADHSYNPPSYTADANKDPIYIWHKQ